MSEKRDYHVVPDGSNGWRLQREGGERATSLHGTQREAIEAGRAHAINQHVEVVIHRPNGQFRDSDSYGNDPSRSHDRKH